MLSTCLIYLSHLLVSSTCLIYLSRLLVSSTCLVYLSHLLVSSTCLSLCLSLTLLVSHSACLIYLSHLLVSHSACLSLCLSHLLVSSTCLSLCWLSWSFTGCAALTQNKSSCAVQNHVRWYHISVHDHSLSQMFQCQYKTSGVVLSLRTLPAAQCALLHCQQFCNRLMASMAWWLVAAMSNRLLAHD